MKNFLLTCMLILPLTLVAQIINGEVKNEKNEPLIGAYVFSPDKKLSTVTNEEGRFSLLVNGDLPSSLIATYVGYSPDTLVYEGQFVLVFGLKESAAIQEVVVSGKREGVIISNLNSSKVEQITQTELGKAACCDLAGCFETQSSVQPQTTNVITNAKELRILGLSGVYNQVLIDGFPMIQGLTYTYGISSVPGTLVDNIFISKGANSVVQGFESISGQINVETKEPDNTDKLFLNVYVNSFLEKHLNANYAIKKGKWSNLSAFHMVQAASSFDRDEDTFMDVPKLTRYMFSNKLKYGKESKWGWHSKLGFRYLDEQRVGGQVNYQGDRDKGSKEVYGQTVQIRQPEFYSRSGYRFNDQHHLVLFASALYQDQDSYFGTVFYDAQQSNLYGNLQYELNYGDNSLKAGLSYRYLNLDERISFTENILERSYEGQYLKEESILGAFAENTLRLFDGKLTWVAGLRMDDHNSFGLQLSPRTLLKYDLTERAVLRANIGMGWRTVNLFSENIGLLISSRDIVFAESLEPEKALNMGVNFTQKFDSGNVSGFFSTDFYHTDFQNQIFPDYDQDPGRAVVSNFTGESVSNTFQAELYLQFSEQFEFKTGYSYLDVYRMQDSEKVLLPFNSKHNVVNTFSYTPLSKKYHVDMNWHIHGPQRLPDTQNNPIQYRRPDFSDTYSTLNAQFTYSLKKWEWYLGCENIFDFRQERPIIGWQDPFGKYFDTSSVWGPTRGREFYLGIRFKLLEE